YAVGFLSVAVFGFALLRFGLFAMIVTSMVSDLASLGGSLDFGTWYAAMSAIPLVLIVAIAAYGFKTSLGGRPLFRLE
ncbi:MAG TPA: hypothetical protein VKE70_06835, partial [Candidatus Solibacter sp.]|nr:hypothetical protein [Candidatus Solibacter sp.]